jgi:molecular chaperone GrpE (heat shock protein)
MTESITSNCEENLIEEQQENDQINQQDDDDDQKKNQACKYWSSGKCKFGEHCRFSHDTPLSPYAQLRMMSAYYSQYSNAAPIEYGNEAAYPEAAGTYARSTMVTPCKFFYKGKCKYGYNCRFSHLQPYAIPYGPNMFPYAYAPYGGYPVYRPPNGLFRRPYMSMEQEYQEQEMYNEEEEAQNEQNNGEVDLESLKHNMHHSLSNFQQQFDQYKNHQKTGHASTNVKSLNEIARALQDLSQSFAQALQQHDQEVATSGINIISYLKSLIPTLTEEDVQQIDNICNREKLKSNERHLEHQKSHSDSEFSIGGNGPKKKKNKLNPRLVPSPKKEGTKKPTHSQGSITASPVDTTLPQYAPNSYAAVLCKPRPDNHIQQQTSTSKLSQA